MSWISSLWRSSVGGKVTMAVTGLLLYLFVIAHLLGNLQIFAGPDKLNGYALMLKNLGPMLWFARIGLAAIFVLHVVTGIRLARANRSARPVRYECEDTMKATWASRSMVLSGLSVLGFVVYHLLHFTLGVTNPEHFALRTADGHHDVYAMVVKGFSNPAISGAYIAFQLMLFFHLSHGFQSLMQTLGIHHGRYTPLVKRLGWLLAAAVAGGNIFIPVAVLMGMVR